ncbi:MAG: hypothetical protein R3C46_12740 [Hyphomonadaceae bacterium]
MSRSAIWSVVVFTFFAFATLIVFFWIRDGSLREAGASMDGLLGRTGNTVVETTDEIVQSTGDAIQRATDGDDAT